MSGIGGGALAGGWPRPRRIRSFIFALTVPISITSISLSITLFVLLVLLPVDPLARLLPLRDLRLAVVVIFLARRADVLRPVAHSLRFIVHRRRCSRRRRRFSSSAPLHFALPFSLSFTRRAIVSFALFFAHSLGVRALVQVTALSRTVAERVGTVRAQSRRPVRRVAAPLIVPIVAALRTAVLGVGLLKTQTKFKSQLFSSSSLLIS